MAFDKGQYDIEYAKKNKKDRVSVVTKANIISGRKLAFVPILRAGLGMVVEAVTILPLYSTISL